MGQLGLGDRRPVQCRPQRVVATLEHVRIVAVAGGETHSLAVDDEGAIYSFGAGEAGDRAGWCGGWLGHGCNEETKIPQRITALAGHRVVAVAAGRRHSLALVDGGHIFSFGAGELGKLGHNSTLGHWLPRRVEALASERVVGISAGDSHNLCALADGRIFAWGAGALGLEPSQLIEQPLPAHEAFGSAGNYEGLLGDEILRRQSRRPLEVRLPHEPRE